MKVNVPYPPPLRSCDDVIGHGTAIGLVESQGDLLTSAGFVISVKDPGKFLRVLVDIGISK